MWKLSEVTVEEFIKEAANRTYHLPSRSFYLNEIGEMIIPVPILRLDPSGTFKVSFYTVKWKKVEFRVVGVLFMNSRQASFNEFITMGSLYYGLLR